MTSYLIAKYVQDLSRNEPRNIGVIAYDGSRAVARFDGEDDAERVDLRRVRHRITGSRTYLAWVEYWRRALREPGILDRSIKGAPPGDSTVIDRLLEVPGGDFYLEPGGTILFDASRPELRETVDELFTRLVREDEQPTPPDLRKKSRDALAAAGAPLDDEARFKERVPLPVDVEGVRVEEEVSYAVMNGSWNFLQEVSFDSSSPRRSRKEVSHCVFLFEHALRESGSLILYDQTDLVAESYPLLELLRRFGPTVNVDNTDNAAEAINERLGL
jgi:hypothetical protein